MSKVIEQYNEILSNYESIIDDLVVLDGGGWENGTISYSSADKGSKECALMHISSCLNALENVLDQRRDMRTFAENEEYDFWSEMHNYAKEQLQNIQ